MVTRQPGEFEVDFVRRATIERDAHERKMMVLLAERYGVNPRDPNANVKLLTAVARDYIESFRDDDGPGVGRPPTAITNRQFLAIQRGLAKQQDEGRKLSPLAECRKLVDGDEAAKALAAAYKRATK